MFTKNIYTRILTIVVAAFIHALAITLFIRPSGLISSGFTGLALLIEQLFPNQNYLNASSIMVLLNVPVAIFCFKAISKNFVLLSLLEVLLVSLIINYVHFEPLFEDIFLNTIFAGVLNGFAIVLSLKANASSGGTDFIALYVSNKKQKSIFNYVLIFNIMLVLTLSITKGIYIGGYTIVFQFITNYVIKTYYNRFDRLTLQIVTAHKDEVIKNYVSKFKHGVSVTEVQGGFSNNQYYLLTTVISINEKQKIVDEILKTDPKAIINIFKSTDFVGGFYLEPIN